MDLIFPPPGRVRTYRTPGPSLMQQLLPPNLRTQRLAPGVKPFGWKQVTDWTPNTVLYEWGAIVGPLMTEGLVNFRIGGMYLEYCNVDDPEDEVPIPSYGREAEHGIDYYNSLVMDDQRDYLRVPMTAVSLGISDPVKFPKGNLPTFFAQSSGVVGANGKPFSDTVNSKLVGGALVAFVHPTDYTQDLVLSRFYLPTGEQQSKLATSQVGLEWELSLQ